MEGEFRIESGGAEVDRELRQYALGQLSGEQLDRVEERVFTDDDFHQLAEAVEDELVEDYVAGRLSTGDRQQFERRRRLSRHLNRKVFLHRTLLRHIRRPAWERWLAALSSWMAPIPSPVPALAVALLVVGGGVWVSHRIVQLQREVQAARNDTSRIIGEGETLAARLREERLRGDGFQRKWEQSGAELTRIRQQVARPLLASFVLKAGPVRSGSVANRIAVAPGQLLIELKLDIGIDDYERYVAVLRDTQGRELMTQTLRSKASASDTDYVVMLLPSALLERGDYVIELRGFLEDGSAKLIGSYPFRTVFRQSRLLTSLLDGDLP